MWDESCPGLGVLASPTKKNFIFEGRFNGKTIRITIGLIKSWTINEARKRAGEIRQQINSCIDPREEIRRRKEAEEQTRIKSRRKDSLVSDAWLTYLQDRKDDWSERHYADHEALAQAGGRRKERAKGKTVSGVLHSLMYLRLSEITPDEMIPWVKKESKRRKTQCRLGFSLFREFVNWCNDHENYKDLIHPDACSAKVRKKGNFHKFRCCHLCLEAMSGYFQVQDQKMGNLRKRGFLTENA